MNLVAILLIIVYGIIGGLSTAVLTISLPVLIIWKFYRKFKYHKACLLYTSLVLAEKPSVARDIAHVLKCGKSLNGAMEGQEYIVTWGLGHLVTLADPEDYHPVSYTHLGRGSGCPWIPDCF